MTAVIKNLKNHDVVVLKRIYGDNVAVLQPHGRLIDADALFAHMVAVHKKWKDNPELYKTIIPIVEDELIVACFPTMIDAEDGER